MSIDSITYVSGKDIKNISPLRILCVCRHGNVRSVALAYLLKLIYGHDVIAVGTQEASGETLLMLYKWADRVYILDMNLHVPFLKKVGLLYTDGPKITIVDVGEDIWFDPFHHSLQHKLLKKLKDLDL